MNLTQYLETNRDNSGVMAAFKRGLREGFPSNEVYRHLAAAGVDTREDVLPQALQGLAFALYADSSSTGVSVGASLASLEVHKEYDPATPSSLEKRLMRLADRPLCECLPEVVNLLQMLCSSGAPPVDHSLLFADAKKWQEGYPVPVTTWVRV